MEESIFHIDALNIDNVSISYIEWRSHLIGKKPSILFLHATGFHCRLWDQIAAQLPDYHVIAPDLRGHGQSSKLAIDHWSILAQDILNLIKSLEMKAVIGVGHSVGGHALIETAVRLPEVFKYLLLLDPVVGSPEFYSQNEKGVSKDFLKPILERKCHFQSTKEMIDRFYDRRPYSIFTEECLKNYCIHGLHKSKDGFTLACPPDIEASFYASSASNRNILHYANQVNCPATIVRARDGKKSKELSFEGSPTWSKLASVFANGKDIQLKDLSHFIPMQAPQLCLDLVDDITQELA